MTSNRNKRISDNKGIFRYASILFGWIPVINSFVGFVVLENRYIGIKNTVKEEPFWKVFLVSVGVDIIFAMMAMFFGLVMGALFVRMLH